VAGRSFRKNLARDKDVTLTPKQLASLFDLDHALRFAPRIVARALAGHRAPKKRR
jgi:hypothetical protein